MDPNRVAFRIATLTDAPSLAGVQLRSALAGFAHIFPGSVPKPTQASLEDEWSRLVADPALTVVVAVVDDAPVGVVAFGPGESTLGGDCVLLKLYVLPDHSGRGIGGELHDLAVSELMDAGFSKARLWVLEGNSVARRMYERRGWKKERESRTDWPGTGIEELAYSLELGHSSAM